MTILASCSRTNLLNYKYRIHYEENSIITSNTTFTLYQNVCYNRPGTIDEEFCYDLTLTFLDTTAAKTKKILNLETDTLIIKSRCGKSSVWFDSGNNKVTGQIEICVWDKNAVTLKENIYASGIGCYKGTRTYKKKESR